MRKIRLSKLNWLAHQQTTNKQQKQNSHATVLRSTVHRWLPSPTSCFFYILLLRLFFSCNHTNAHSPLCTGLLFLSSTRPVVWLVPTELTTSCPWREDYWSQGKHLRSIPHCPVSSLAFSQSSFQTCCRKEGDERDHTCTEPSQTYRVFFVHPKETLS